MLFKNPATNITLAVVGVLLVIGAFSYLNLRVTEPTVPESTIEESAVTEEETTEPTSPMEGTAPAPKPTTSKPTLETPKPPTSTGAPPVSSGGGTGSNEETTVGTPAESPQEEIVPVPYNPGFMASSRVTPEIPSENERATLPSCEGKLFTVNPVNLSVVANIRADGSFHNGDIAEYAVFNVLGSGELNKYDLYAPGDVWITHLAQETGISADPEDTTIYFALCRDVVGYITHVKELSSDTYKIITDSYCLGKPHTGPNACEIKTLTLVSQGSSLGRVGRIEGSFGIGVIDLRKERGLTGVSGYSIKTNFAACPFDYFIGKNSYYGKLSSGTSLCSVPQ